MTTTLRLNQLDLSRRRIVRWDHGKKITIEDVLPSPFDSVRAAAIETTQRATDCHCVNISRVMTNEEIAYTLAVWDTIADSRSSFTTAFQVIRRDEILP